MADFTVKHVFISSISTELKHGQLYRNGTGVLVTNGLPAKRTTICITIKHSMHDLRALLESSPQQMIMVLLHVNDHILNALKPASTECALVFKEVARIPIVHNQVPSTLCDVSDQLLAPRKGQDVGAFLCGQGPIFGLCHVRQWSSASWILTGVEINVQVEVVPRGESMVATRACWDSIEDVTTGIEIKLTKIHISMSVGSVSTQVGKLISLKGAVWAIKQPLRLDGVRRSCNADRLA